MQYNYLIADHKGNLYDGLLKTTLEASELQKVVDKLQSEGKSGEELIEALEEKGIKYFHIEDDRIIVE